MKNLTIAAAAASALFASTASAQSYSTGFEAGDGFVPGAIGVGADEGNSNWQAPSNGAASGTIVTGVARTGTQSLALGNNGSGNDGVIHGVRSPELSAGAGETASGAASNQFFSSFWFRSGDWQPGGDYFASVNAWSTDRMTWVGLDYSSGIYSVYASGMDGSDSDFLPDATIATGLAVGEWYRLDQSILFVDSANGGDDQVTFSLFNSGGTQIGSTLTTSWDDGYLGADRFYPGATLTPVNQMNFRTPGSAAGTAFYIDDVSYSIGRVGGAVPEPSTWALMILGFGLVGGAMRQRRARATLALA